jgi:hypothetical protein
VKKTVSRFYRIELSVVLSTVPVLLLVACGALPSPALSSADKRICDDAFQNDEVAIYIDGPGASNDQIKSEAAQITMTSSTSVDAAAVQNIINTCKQSGYAKPASPGSVAAIGSSRSVAGVGSPRSTTGTSGPGTAAETPSPTQARWTAPPAHGILECGLSFDSQWLSHSGLAMADPATGRIIWTENIAPAAVNGWSPIGCGPCRCAQGSGDTLTPPYALENFSSDFRRAAATNGGQVGWIDASTGAVTDASQITPPSSPGFGATPGQDSNPMFDPQDNSFWFERSSPATNNTVTTSLMRIPNGGSQAVIARSASSDFSVGFSNNGTLVDFQALAPGPYSHVAVNPSGSVALDCEAGVGVAPGQCQLASPIDGPWTAANVSGSDVDALVNTWVYIGGDWISDTQLIGIPSSPGGTTPVDLATYVPGTTSISSATLISDAGNAKPRDFILSPDGNAVEFIALDPTGKAFLYKIGLADLGGQPSQLGPIGDSFTTGQFDLLAWR